MKRTRSRPADDAPRGRGRPPWHGAARLIYLSGVAHSAVFHTLLLLLLAAIAARDEPDKVGAIEMSFDHSSAVPPSSESVPSITVIDSATIDGQSSPPAATPAGAPLPAMAAAPGRGARGAGGGVLDVDMNAAPPRLTAGPVENVFWPFGRPPVGRITVGVHHFHSWFGRRRVPVTVVMKLADEPPREFNVVAVSDAGPQRVTTFTVDE